MSQTKTVDGMAYESTGKRKTNSKQVAVQMAEQVSTPRLVWLLVYRHKVGLLLVGNIILLLNYAIPEWTNIIRSLVR